jgi:hypothetical protein
MEEFMIKMVAAVGLFLVLSLAGSGFAGINGPEEVEKLKEALASGSSVQRTQIAKIITNAGIEDQGLYEKIAALLRDGYPKGFESDHVDEMSWLCKALAASGDPRYKALLQEIAEKAPSFKLQHYAKESKHLIGEYADRMRIMNSTETWDDNLNHEENRLANMLKSDNIQLKKDAAKTVVRSIMVHKKIFEIIDVELLGMQGNKRTRGEDIDTMAWMCKALAVSGDARYAETLKQVMAGTMDIKLKTAASKALKQID